MIHKRVDHTQKNFKEVRGIWNWLRSINGAEDNENPIGIQRFEFGKRWGNNYYYVNNCLW